MGLWFGSFETPIGALTAAVDDSGAVKLLHFGSVTPRDALRDDRAVAEVRRQVDGYFVGTRRVFDLPLAPDGPRFNREVWEGLLTIKFGETLSYGALAARIGKPGMARPVGTANGANPIALIIPCHRVIGADGTLTGYGGGIRTKAALLAHEGVLPQSLVARADARTRIDQLSLF